MKSKTEIRKELEEQKRCLNHWENVDPYGVQAITFRSYVEMLEWVLGED